MTPYIPKPEKEGINYAREGFLKEFVLLCLGALVLVFALSFILAGTIRIALSWLTPETETELLAGFSPVSASDYKIGQEILDKLTSGTDLKLKIGVLCDEDPNAFAMPGGRVMVTQGLLKNISSENALAFVLAHEIGHFVGRDHLNSLGIGIGAALALSIIGLDSTAAVFGDLSSSAFIQSYSRDQETKADAYAVDLLIKKYGGLIGADGFFKYVIDTPSLNLDPIWLQSHPDTSERLKSIENNPYAKAGELKKLPVFKDAGC